ncbi:BON domain-containing protein [Edaphobacter aggregans]|uniref:BON domain-containing protein n=1 Tax=Edaphobacter aggregans TaxID=570835 RepID=A0A428ME34_9BACT|nr:BON domain-containing protein [Edaphobacter aggregans]RSL15119.1 BON domain-containing protein [Edaphobacter aggregans]
MEKSTNLSTLSRVASFAVLLVLSSIAFAQAQPATVPDAQIESNVLKALASSSTLADQSISTTTVYGTVTLSGTVRDEASRDLAEKVVSTTEGVKKVVDELTIGTSAPAAAGVPQQPENPADQGTNPNLQSDGTMAPSAPQQTQTAPPQQTQSAPPQSYPNDSAPPQASVQQQPPPQAPYGPYRQPYGRPYGPPPSGYNQPQPYAYPQQQPMVAQRGGDAVIVPAGTVLRVRINQGMDSRKTAPGTPFDGIVLSDVIAGGSIAIPRGATVQGVVTDVHDAGQFKGRGGLSLQLTQVALGGQVYPLVSSLWSQQGADKTGSTVGNTVGLSAVGAMIGAIAGGGVGAAVGAGVGGVAGLGVSSASRQGEVMIPAEAILSFSLTQPTELTTVSQAELNRLGAGVPVGGQPAQLQRRYPPPPPPPYYYGPAYYYPRY